MLKVLILYYLSLKPTHGYEIQKFIQISHMDCWTKIQSGSIYYALSKLEQEGLIEREAGAGSGPKARKVYHITEQGKTELKILARKELNCPISEVGSDKFIVYPLLGLSGRADIQRIVRAHISELEEKKAGIERWRKAKVGGRTLEVERVSFQMMISDLEYQIRWHEALLAQLDECIAASEEIAGLITATDFSAMEIEEAERITDLESLKRHARKW